jgi:hypothetical protein
MKNKGGLSKLGQAQKYGSHISVELPISEGGLMKLPKIRVDKRQFNNAGDEKFHALY